MDIKQLKFLIALDETRHFGQAAARCHVTQPTLSMRLRNLEEELGLELVTRGQRFEGFTEPGQRILAWARSVLAAHDGLLAEAAITRGNLSGKLRMGVVPLSAFDPLPLLQRLHARHPHLRFELSALSSDDILEGLASNRLDMGVSYLDRLDGAHFESLDLAETRMALLYDQRHFSFEGEDLVWEQLAELRLGVLSAGMHFRQSIDHGFRSRGLTLAPLLETDAVHQLLQAVHGGFCCAIMPMDSGMDALTDHLRLHPISNANTIAPVGLIMRRHAPRSPLADVCFREMRELLSQD